MVNRPGAAVCRNCGLPVARPSDPLRGVAPGWFQPIHRGPPMTMSVLGVGLVVGVLLVGAMLTLSGNGVLRYGGRFGVSPTASPSAPPTNAPGASAAPGQAVASTAPLAVSSGEPTDQATSSFSCQDAEIADVTRSRWRLATARAGARRRFDRVALDLVRSGSGRRQGVITLEWMSPEDARATFGLPRFDGRRGILVSFGRTFSTPGAQLIGPTDLREEGISSMSGVYRFTDRDGVARVYIAIRDDSCVRMTAPELQGEDRPARRTSIFLDLAEG